MGRELSERPWKPQRLRRSLRMIVLALCAMGFGAADDATAQDHSRSPPVATYQAMLDAARPNGWVGIAARDGKELVYFTPLLMLSCRLREIRYSINSRELDETFPLMDCNPQLPFSMPSDVIIEELLIRLDPGTVETVAVQVVWEDGRESQIQVYRPCDIFDERACAWPVD